MQVKHVLSGHRRQVNSAVLMKDGSLALSGSDDRTIRFWDVRNEREIAVLDGHTGPVVSVQVSHNETYAVSAGQDRTVRLWSIESVMKNR